MLGDVWLKMWCYLVQKKHITVKLPMTKWHWEILCGLQYEDYKLMGKSLYVSFGQFTNVVLDLVQ